MPTNRVIFFCDKKPTSVVSHYQTEGLSGLYRGLVPTMMRAFPSNAIVIVAYENVRDLL